MKKFDVIVIGAGHAGLEAAAAAARVDVSVALITKKRDDIGKLSCNPAIGGVGKGTIVREIDALGGLMAKLADKAAIHYKLLNSSKGAAVHGPRIQADRKLYAQAAYDAIMHYDNVEVIIDTVEQLIFSGGKTTGVKCCYESYEAEKIILTSGTFLNGVTHIGKITQQAGRVGDAATYNITEQLHQYGVKTGRLKTGTPARLVAETIDFNKCEKQYGDAIPQPMSYDATPYPLQTLCHITRTNAATHAIINNNLNQSAVYSGAITSKGPRYCPSIEDKIVRFSSKDSHQIFLEPEGLDSNLIYPNGISTSLPADVQRDFIRTISGLEDVEIAQYGYAVEYDYVYPTQLNKTLELKNINGLYLAGQINGTTGYEEAGGQGLIAGANAALSVLGKSALLLDRKDAYIGVMIDDLISKGVAEPYRMFTSRVEYRLSIRADNAYLRLKDCAVNAGLITQEKCNHYRTLEAEIATCIVRCKAYILSNSEKALYGLSVSQKGDKLSLFSALQIPDFNQELAISDILADEFSKVIIEQAIIQAKYSGHIEKELQNIDRLSTGAEVVISSIKDFKEIKSLSNEAVEKLNLHLPKTLGEAAKISGITPSAIISILAHVRKTSRAA
jgi:tRNA uridine 5-carboxymethylaminomethyl modification enzyme